MSQPLPRAPAPDWRQYVIRALIWVGFVGALGYSAANGGLDFLENDVSVKLEPNRDAVALHGTVPPVIQLRVTLKNSTQNAVALDAASACNIFRWQIFSRSAELMQTSVPDDKCPSVPVTAGLRSGEKIEEFYAISLVPDRYQAGNDYQVKVWYWGYEGTFEFRAE
jgi:hypothetical protein